MDGPWGMSQEDVRQSVEAAKSDGMTTIDEISIKKDGYIEVEGEDSNGRDIELRVNKPVSNKS